MNIKQMKQTISKFRAADVSIIKDEKLRAKAQKLQAKQGGFTLLELLVVITLLATLATAALVAYEGLGENAADASAANNIIVSESSIRNFRAVEDVYPNQWDNLANLDGTVDGANATVTTGTAPTGAASLLDDDTLGVFGAWNIADTTATAAAATWAAVAKSLNSVGINEFQTLNSNSTFKADNIPNLAFNESNPASDKNAADELEITAAGVATYNGNATTEVTLSIFPSDSGDGTTAGGCTAGGASLATSFDGTAYLDSTALNLINDSLDDDGCHLVLALGFGKDVPGTTLGSRVAISQAPTVGENPAESYSRLIALYHLGSAPEDTNGDSTGVIGANDIFNTPRLIGLVDPAGRNLDQIIAASNESDFEGDND
jgi:prepilin-type N-terminal cleavage/methylation domain-containing protein